MPAENMSDEETPITAKGNGGARAARSMQSESIDSTTRQVTADRGASAESEDVDSRGGAARGRKMKASTEALLDKLEAEASLPDEGDGGPDDPDDPDNDAPPADEGDGETVEEGDAEGETTEESSDEGEGAVDVVKEWQTKYNQLEEANRTLYEQVEAAKRMPRRDRSEYEQDLVDAWKSYIDDGSVPALRKFIGAAIGAKPDSKDVDEELAGVYADLTSNELKVPLDESKQARRDAQRARLALARDKRERAESEKQKAAPVDSDETQQIVRATGFIDNQLTTKGQSGASLAEEFPMLMTLAEDFDGYKPAELLARAVKREYEIGALNPNASVEANLRLVAQKIEAHYEALIKKASSAKPQQNKKTDTTKSGTPAKSASKEQRQNPGARTINNAKASVAPAAPPKQKKQEQPKKNERPQFRSKKEAQDWALRHLPGGDR